MKATKHSLKITAAVSAACIESARAKDNVLLSFKEEARRTRKMQNERDRKKANKTSLACLDQDVLPYIVAAAIKEGLNIKEWLLHLTSLYISLRVPSARIFCNLP